MNAKSFAKSGAGAVPMIFFILYAYWGCRSLATTVNMPVTA